MAEALNRSEVESLLTALNPVRTPVVETAGAAAPNVASPASSSQLAKRVVSVFEDIRRQMSTATEQCLQESLRLKRYMPERLPLSKLIGDSQAETIYLLVESEQNGGDLLICLEAKFARQFVSLMVGQSWEAVDPVAELSHIERRLLMRWVRESLTGVMPPSQWRAIDVEILSSASDFAAYNPQSPWWREQWELKSDPLRGPIQIAGQWEFFSGLGEVIAGQEQQATIPHSPTVANENLVEVTAFWGETEFSAAELGEIEVGTILKSKNADGNAEVNVTLEVNGTTLATGQAGESHESKAVEIRSVDKTGFPEQGSISGTIDGKNRRKGFAVR